MYIIFTFLAVAIITMCIPHKKKLKYRNSMKLTDRLNNKLSKLHYKKGSKNHSKLQQKIVNAGVTISPEKYQTVRLVLPVAVIAVYIFFKIINFINLQLSIKNLIEAARVLNDESILNIKLNINLLIVLLMGVMVFMLPDLILFFMEKIRTGISKREALILQTYAIMLLKTTKPVKQILISLYERADYFKPLLKTANEKYSTDQNVALAEMKNSAPQNSDFINICIALQQALTGDRKLSVMYLENHRHLAREVNKQVRIRNQTRNQGIGILIMIVPLITAIAIVGYPWLIYTIRSISLIPI